MAAVAGQVDCRLPILVLTEEKKGLYDDEKSL
jgi:hypothetical protein